MPLGRRQKIALTCIAVAMLYVGGYVWARAEHWLIHRSAFVYGQTDSHFIAVGDLGLIAAYRPKPGKADALRALMHTHLPRLRAEGLVTARESILMEAKDGTFVEVFEWKSKEAIEAAHHNAAVPAMWSEYADVCDYAPLASLAEAQQLFSEFTPVNPDSRLGR